MSADRYFEQLFSAESRAQGGWIGWKVNSTGYNISRKLWELRDRAKGKRPAIGGHLPVILWMPYVGHAACLGCTWIDPGAEDLDLAAARARSHGATTGMPPDNASALTVEVVTSKARDWRPPPDLPRLVHPH